jgi:sec-independent protein translocase protein TatC
LDWLARPVGQFIFTGPTEAFFAHMQVAFTMGGLAALPVWIYHVWRFAGRALKLRERSVIVGILPYALVLFFIGAAVAVFIVVPAAMKFLLNYGSPRLVPMISLREYLGFIFWMVMGFGVFFQLPLVVITLARFGIVDPNTFAGYRRHMIVGIFLAAAVLTPGPDLVSQLVLAVPSYLLFELSLIVARRVYRR